MQAKDFTLSIKANEFKGKQTRKILHLWIAVKSIKTRKLKYHTRNNQFR